MNFADIIQSLLKEKGIPINKMLKDLGLATGSYNNWKNNGSKPNADTVSKIADYLNVSTDLLLGRSAKNVNDTIRFYTEPIERRGKNIGIKSSNMKPVFLGGQKVNNVDLPEQKAISTTDNLDELTQIMIDLFSSLSTTDKCRIITMLEDINKNK